MTLGPGLDHDPTVGHFFSKYQKPEKFPSLVIPLELPLQTTERPLATRGESRTSVQSKTKVLDFI